MKKGLKRWVAGLAAVISILVFSIVSWVWIVFSGGIGGVIRNAKPNINPYDKNIIQRRGIVISEIDSSFKEIEGWLRFKEYATSTHDRCHRGKSDWKISEPYSNHCGFRITKFYGLNGDFRQSMLNLETELYSHGWKKPEYTSKNPMESLMYYYDKNYGKKVLDREDIYDVSYLPSTLAEYTKGGEKFEILFAEKSTTNFKDIEYFQNENSGVAASPETFELKNFQDIPEVFSKVTRDYRYLIVISIQKAYFEN